MAQRISTLQRTVVFERRTFGMAVGVPGRDVEVVEHPAFLDQVGRTRDRRFLEQSRDHVTPGFLPERQVQRPIRLLGRLLSREAGPLVPPGPLRISRLIQITLRLCPPIG